MKVPLTFREIYNAQVKLHHLCTAARHEDHPLKKAAILALIPVQRKKCKELYATLDTDQKALHLWTTLFPKVFTE